MNDNSSGEGDQEGGKKVEREGFQSEGNSLARVALLGGIGDWKSQVLAAYSDESLELTAVRTEARHAAEAERAQVREASRRVAEASEYTPSSSADAALASLVAVAASAARGAKEAASAAFSGDVMTGPRQRVIDGIARACVNQPAADAVAARAGGEGEVAAAVVRMPCAALQLPDDKLGELCCICGFVAERCSMMAMQRSVKGTLIGVEKSCECALCYACVLLYTGPTAKPRESPLCPSCDTPYVGVRNERDSRVESLCLGPHTKGACTLCRKDLHMDAETHNAGSCPRRTRLESESRQARLPPHSMEKYGRDGEAWRADASATYKGNEFRVCLPGVPPERHRCSPPRAEEEQGL